MSGFTIFMIAFVVVGLPVILGVFGAMYERTLKHRERMAEVMSAQTAEKAAQYAAQNERFDQRVQVLERIITDRGTSVAAQIEALREQPLN